LSVVDEAVENGVGIGRIADHGVPALDRELAGDDGGVPPLALSRIAVWGRSPRHDLCGVLSFLFLQWVAGQCAFICAV
jgi:hypothetical protein